MADVGEGVKLMDGWMDVWKWLWCLLMFGMFGVRVDLSKCEFTYVVDL